MDNKNEIIKLMEGMDGYPSTETKKTKVKNYTKISFSRLAT